MHKALITILLLPTLSLAAVAFGGETRGASFAVTNTKSWTGPVAAGSNLAGVVTCAANNSVVIGTATWDGVSMTEVSAARDVNSVTNQITQILVLTPIPTGAKTIVVTTVSGNWFSAFCDAIYITGAHQTQASIVDTGTASNTGSTTQATFSENATVNASSELIIDSVCNDGLVTNSATSPSTKTNGGNSNTTADISWGSSYYAPPSTGSIAMAWSNGGTSVRWTGSTVSLKPPAAAAAPTMPPIIAER